MRRSPGVRSPGRADCPDRWSARVRWPCISWWTAWRSCSAREVRRNPSPAADPAGPVRRPHLGGPRLGRSAHYLEAVAANDPDRVGLPRRGAARRHLADSLGEGGVVEGQPADDHCSSTPVPEGVSLLTEAFANPAGLVLEVHAELADVLAAGSDIEVDVWTAALDDRPHHQPCRPGSAGLGSDRHPAGASLIRRSAPRRFP